MIIKFTTKRDINGNRKTLIIDQDGRTYRRDYNTARDYSEYITITARDREKLIQQLDAAGYTQIF